MEATCAADKCGCNALETRTSSTKRDTLFGKLLRNHHSLEKLRLVKNLLVLSFGVLTIYTAFEALTNLQSTMNSRGGIGSAALVTVYGSLLVSTSLLPVFVMKRFGCKLTMVFSAACLVPYISANILPVWGTMIPTAVLFGAASGPFWAARNTYINEICRRYSETKTNYESITVLFFGISSMFYQGAQIWGNVISYLVLKPRDEFPADDLESVAGCGASFCPSQSPANRSNHNLDSPSHEKRNLLTAIYVLLCVLTVILFWLFLDQLENEAGSSSESRSIRENILAIFRQMKQKEQLLLLPITFYIGFSDGFLFGDFTRVYIACSWGVYHVGLVMTSYGTISSIACALSGLSVNIFGKIPVFVFAGVINLATYLFLLEWEPQPYERAGYFLVASAWGFSDAIWWSQVLALYGYLFASSGSAAYSNFYFWNSIGFLVAYAIEEYVCTRIKLYCLIGILISSIAGFLVLQLNLCGRKHVKDHDKLPAASVN